MLNLVLNAAITSEYYASVILTVCGRIRFPVLLFLFAARPTTARAEPPLLLTFFAALLALLALPLSTFSMLTSPPRLT